MNNQERDIRHRLLQKRYFLGDRIALDSLAKDVDNMCIHYVARALGKKEGDGSYDASTHPYYDIFLSFARERLVNAARNWNPEKASWPTYVFFIVKSSINHSYKSMIFQQRENKEAFSLDQFVYNSGAEEESAYTIDHYNFEDAVEEEDFVTLFEKTLTPLQATVLSGMQEGVPQSAMPETFGMNKTTVRRTVREIREAFVLFKDRSRKIYAT